MMLCPKIGTLLKKGSDEGQSAYNTLGHRAEPTYLSQFYKFYLIPIINNVGSSDSGDSFAMQTIYRPGLVYNRKRFYLRDSADGVALMTKLEDGCDEALPHCCIPIECKCRASQRTFQRERNNIINLHTKPTVMGLRGSLRSRYTLLVLTLQVERCKWQFPTNMSGCRYYTMQQHTAHSLYSSLLAPQKEF